MHGGWPRRTSLPLSAASRRAASLPRTRFIDLVEEVPDVLVDSRLPHYEDASDDLDHAATYLTDALTEPGADQAALLAQARTHPRDAIETAS
ncbi:hypothetical protein [Streptomyces sp. NPDC059209]|uniref:hypothetical protein n=1 Tax=Streptomyces sp. NPDC059209 TaxID=3346769 RepID=UPI00368AB1C9